IEPSSVAISQRVGQYIPHADGRKSRCKLVITITKRSSHIPTFTTRHSTNNSGSERRTRRNQSARGNTTLHASVSQVVSQYGPLSRFTIMYWSYTLPESQESKPSIR